MTEHGSAERPALDDEAILLLRAIKAMNGPAPEEPPIPLTRDQLFAKFFVDAALRIQEEPRR